MTFMRTVKKSAKIAKFESKNVEQEVQATVRSYKATPYPATGYSPYNLMFGGDLKGKLPRKLRNRKTLRTSIKRCEREMALRNNNGKHTPIRDGMLPTVGSKWMTRC